MVEREISHVIWLSRVNISFCTLLHPSSPTNQALGMWFFSSLFPISNSPFSMFSSFYCIVSYIYTHIKINLHRYMHAYMYIYILPHQILWMSLKNWCFDLNIWRILAKKLEKRRRRKFGKSFNVKWRFWSSSNNLLTLSASGYFCLSIILMYWRFIYNVQNEQ